MSDLIAFFVVVAFPFLAVLALLVEVVGDGEHVTGGMPVAKLLYGATGPMIGRAA